MAEYIEREALIRKLKCFAADVIFRGIKVIMNDEESCNPVEWTKGYEQGVKDSANLIASQPAADVAPVRHGRWEVFLSDYDDCELMRCSCCGSEFYDGDNDTVDSFHNYCPNCGAKMDGE